MDPSFDIPDSTDWLDTPLSLVAPLESSLRCQVCKDFFDNPVITSCSHTFCSLCIRRCLSSEGKCPVCRCSDQETKLRRNWAVQELVEAFNNARPGVLDLARKARDGGDRGRDEEIEQNASKKRKAEHLQVEEEEEVASGLAVAEGIKTRSQSRRVDDQPQTEMVDLVEDSQDEDYVPEDGLVACPICSRRMKNEAVFQHLDTCNGDQGPPKQTSFGSFHPMSPVLRRQPPQKTAEKPPERLPIINYSILKENVLRKKLKDLGIPNWGPRPLLQRRHTEWMNLWNANCDSKFPKSKRELLRELDAWERTQGGNANPSSIDSTNTIMGKGFNAMAWSSSHGDDFKRLIANAQKKSDAVHKPAPQVQVPVASNEHEMSPFPEQEEKQTIPEPEAPVHSSDVNRIESQAQPIQNGNIIVSPEYQTRDFSSASTSSAILPVDPTKPYGSAGPYS